MKTLLIVTVAFLVSQLAVAQVKDGKIIYERKVNMHKRLTGEQASMRNMVPEFSTFRMQLLFSENESIFKQIETEEDIRDQAGGPEDGRIIVRMGGDNEVYKNCASGKIIELRELGPRKYIIEDSIRSFSWKLDEAEARTIKEYACKKATTKNPRGGEIVAWYTDQIPCPGGPEVFGGLPGMILELNIGDGEIVFSPLEIVIGSDQKMVKAPNNGKKISRKEFEKMLEEELGPEAGGGGPVIRIMRN